MGDGGLNFLNNEPVTGESLADRLASGPVPAEDALSIALALGNALAQIHHAGKVHGYLSPEAIVLTAGGVEILQLRPVDEGLHLPYRAPEEVRGEHANWRSDIFAFGGILYELVAGRRAFRGEGAELNEAILERPPAELMAKSPVHAGMEGVIAACLQKEPAQRRQRVRNAVIELKLAARSLPRAAEQMRSAAERPALPPPAPKLSPDFAAAFAMGGQTPAAAGRSEYWIPEVPARYGLGLRRRFVVIGLAVLALAASGVAAALYLHKTVAPVLKFSVAAPEHTSYPGTPAVSPDGLLLTFSAVGPEGQRMLWLRAFDEMHAKVLPGTEGGFAPFWSPDSDYIAFFAHENLMRIRVKRGVAVDEPKPEMICPAGDEAGGGAWNKDNTIVFAPTMTGGLFRVSAMGGNAAALLKPDTAAGQTGYLWPQFLPDGKHLIYFVQTNMPDTTTGVYTASLEAGAKPAFLFSSATNAIYSTIAGASSSSGYLLYIKDRDLMGEGFNASKLELTGDPMVLANDIGMIHTLSLAPISASRNAVLVYQTVGKPTRQMVWMDREGRPIGTLGESGDWGPPRIAPDGVRVIAGKLGKDGVNANLWIFGADGTPAPFEVDTGYSAGSPVWSPDGSRIAFWETAREKNYDVYVKPVAPGGKAELLYKSDFRKYPTDWSRDGKSLLFGEITPDTKSDIWNFNIAERRAGTVVNTIHSEGYPALSPDRKWLAYQSDESGDYQVYVQAWDGGTPGTKRLWRISTASGGLPRWRADGKELFYLTAAGTMMSAAVHATEGEFQFDPPRQLFETRAIPKTWNLFDVSPDGQRFLMNVPLEWSNSSLITVMTNWTEKLNK